MISDFVKVFLNIVAKNLPKILLFYISLYTITATFVFSTTKRVSCTATYWSYVKRAALYRTFTSLPFVRGNNSNESVAGRISGVVVDEGGHTVCLPSVTINVVVKGG